MTETQILLRYKHAISARDMTNSGSESRRELECQERRDGWGIRGWAETHMSYACAYWKCPPKVTVKVPPAFAFTSKAKLAVPVVSTLTRILRAAAACPRTGNLYARRVDRDLPAGRHGSLVRGSFCPLPTLQNEWAMMRSVHTAFCNVSACMLSSASPTFSNILVAHTV